MSISQSISSFKNKDLYFVSSKKFIIILVPELDKKHLNSLEEMLPSNALLAAKYIHENKLVLNGFQAKPVKWLENLPELVNTSVVSQGAISRLYSRIVEEDFKILATEQYYQSHSLAVKTLEEAGCAVVSIPDCPV